MVLEPNIEQYGSKDVEPQRQVDTEQCVSSKTLSPKRRWIMRSHIDWREKRVRARTLGPEEG